MADSETYKIECGQNYKVVGGPIINSNAPMRFGEEKDKEYKCGDHCHNTLVRFVIEDFMIYKLS